MGYYDIRPPMIHAPEKWGELAPYHQSMSSEVEKLDITFPTGLLLVTCRSPRLHKKAVEKIAYFFKRERECDFPQYSAQDCLSKALYYQEEVETDATLRAFLWYDSTPQYNDATGWPVTGACCFRFRTTLEKSMWVFDWVWVHPYKRRKGYLRNAWPLFKKMFGDFGYTPPPSAAMISFLRNQEGP